MNERVALITGAAGGIGWALVKAFASTGARVVAVDRDEAALDQMAAQANEWRPNLLTVVCDVTDTNAVAAAIDKAVRHFGRIDMAVNNAGIEMEAVAIADADERIFDQVVAVNLKGVFLCLKHEIGQMLRQSEGGSIVNVASVAGLIGAPTMPAYTASKHGVVGLTKSAALGYATKRIRVNAVCPGVVRTPMTERAVAAHPARTQWIEGLHPMGRIATPEEIAAACLWLCSDAASFVTGQALPVDGGMTAR